MPCRLQPPVAASLLPAVEEDDYDADIEAAAQPAAQPTPAAASLAGLSVASAAAALPAAVLSQAASLMSSSVAGLPVLGATVGAAQPGTASTGVLASTAAAGVAPSLPASLAPPSLPQLQACTSNPVLETGHMLLAAPLDKTATEPGACICQKLQGRKVDGLGFWVKGTLSALQASTAAPIQKTTKAELMRLLSLTGDDASPVQGAPQITKPELMRLLSLAEDDDEPLPEQEVSLVSTEPSKGAADALRKLASSVRDQLEKAKAGEAISSVAWASTCCTHTL